MKLMVMKISGHFWNIFIEYLLGIIPYLIINNLRRSVRKKQYKKRIKLRRTRLEEEEEENKNITIQLTIEKKCQTNNSFKFEDKMIGDSQRDYLNKMCPKHPKYPCEFIHFSQISEQRRICSKCA